MAEGFPCSAAACGYVTRLCVPDDTEHADKVQLLQLQMQELQIHTQAVHPQAGVPAARSPGSKAKMDAPKIQLGVDQQAWDQFMTRWNIYKTTMGIDGGTAPSYLFTCLDKDLGDAVLKANPGTEPQNMSEADLTASAKKLAVKVESKLVHRIRMGKAFQQPGVGVDIFFAHLKGLARQCEYTVLCRTCNTATDYSEEVISDQLVRGLADEDILDALIGDEKTDRTLPEMVQFIARKEQAKTERGTVSHENTVVSAVHHPKSPAVQTSTATTCRYCAGKSHGPATPKTRKTLCPAFNHQCEKCKVKGHYQQACFKCSDCSSWGHQSKKSKRCKKGNKLQAAENETAIMMSSMSLSFVGQEIGDLNSVTDLRTAARGCGKQGRKVPIGHHIFKNNAWVRESSAPQPMRWLKAQPCPVDHEEFGHEVSDKGAPHPVYVSVVTDTGCQLRLQSWFQKLRLYPGEDEYEGS